MLKENCMIGIHINCKEKDYIEEMFSYRKQIETRSRKTLHKYRDQRAGLIKTGKGKATLVGYATIGEFCFVYENEKQFRSHYVYHRVEPGSKYDFNKIKYGYLLRGLERCEPVDVSECKMIGRVGRILI